MNKRDKKVTVLYKAKGFSNIHASASPKLVSSAYRPEDCLLSQFCLEEP